MDGLKFQEPVVIKQLAYQAKLPIQSPMLMPISRLHIRHDITIRSDNPAAVRNVQVWLLMASGVKDEEVARLFSLSKSRCLSIVKSCVAKYMDTSWRVSKFGASAQDAALIDLRSRQDQMMVAERLLDRAIGAIIVSNHCISLAREAFAVDLAETEGKQCECSLCGLSRRADSPHLSWHYWIAPETVD